MEKLLILNPGSTSTKIAYYEDEKQIFVESISHSADEIAKYDLIVDQYEFRKDMIMEVLKEKNVKLEELTGIVARGGLLPPLQAGAYRVNDDMVWQLKINRRWSMLLTLVLLLQMQSQNHWEYRLLFMMV